MFHADPIFKDFSSTLALPSVDSVLLYLIYLWIPSVERSQRTKILWENFTELKRHLKKLIGRLTLGNNVEICILK